MKIVAGMPVFLVSQSSRNQFWFLLKVSVLVSAQPLAHDDQLDGVDGRYKRRAKITTIAVFASEKTRQNVEI